MDITVAQVIDQITAVAAGNVLLLAGMSILALGLIPTKVSGEARRNLWGALALFSLGLAAAFAVVGEPVTQSVTGWLFTSDDLTVRGTWLALLGGMLIVLVGWEQVAPNRAADYYGWLMMMIAGLIYTAGARDLTSLFLSLELVSLPTTVLLGISRPDDSGREATLKYFTLAAFTSGFFLLGCSYLYGIAGSTDLLEIQKAFLEQRTPFCTVALTLAIIGLSFRVTAVPFHFYAPDVFSGATLPLAATMSFIPKLAGFLGIVRLLGGATLIQDFPWMISVLILVIAALTMTIGNCAALAQHSLRRLMAYSSIAHSGYLLLALAAIMNNGSGLVAPIFDYLAAYAVMTIGVFAVIASIKPDALVSEDLTLFNGLYYRRPLAAVALTIALLSLTGIPLTAGFWAKLQIFLTTISAGNTAVLVVAVIMAINAAIGAVYYLAIVARIYQAPTAAAAQLAPSRPQWSTSAAAFVCSALTIAWFFAP